MKKKKKENNENKNKRVPPIIETSKVKTRISSGLFLPLERAFNALLSPKKKKENTHIHFMGVKLPLSRALFVKAARERYRKPRSCKIRLTLLSKKKEKKKRE